MQIHGFSCTDVGIDRENNEDYFVVDNELGLFILCDGMGGHAAGQIASKLAADTAVNFIRARKQELDSADLSSPQDSTQRRIVEGAILTACSEVFNHASTHPECAGMGTTITLLLVRGIRAVIGHVGDSRLYLIRDGVVEQLSRDHTLLQEMLDRGGISLEKAKTFPYRNVLSRALGVQQSVQVDISRLDIVPGDLFILCSDGLTDIIDNPQELLINEFDNPQKHSKGLVQLALERKTSDNVTAVCVKIDASEVEITQNRQRVDELTLTMRVLRRMYLFQDLDPDEMMRVVERFSVTSCRSGEILMREGEAGDTLYIILEGLLEVSKNGNMISQLRQGNHVGEMALLSGSPRTATVRVLSDGKLLQIKREDFSELVNCYPITGVKLLSAIARELSSRLGATNDLVGVF